MTALVLTAAVALPASAMAAKKAAKKPVGVLYTETNSPKRNQVQIFHRFAERLGQVRQGGRHRRYGRPAAAARLRPDLPVPGHPG